MNSLASSLFSNPLFSCIISLYLLILLYIPNFFLHLFISPVFISTLILLLTILRLGVSQQLALHNDCTRIKAQIFLEPELIKQGKNTKTGPCCNRVETQPLEKPEPKPEIQNNEPEPNPHWPELIKQSNLETEPHHIRVETQPIEKPGPGPGPEPHWPSLIPVDNREYFIRWEVGAPLEVIYEAYEGEEEGEDEQNRVFNEGKIRSKMIEKYPSLSRYYPESDSDSDLGSDSGSDSSGSSWGREFQGGLEDWDDDDDDDEKEGLIEIALDNNNDDDDNDGKKQGIKKLIEFVHVDDEDNLIEIDISPNRKDHGFYFM